MSTSIEVKHNGAASGWEDQDAHTGLAHYRDAINLSSLKNLPLVQGIIPWVQDAETERFDIFSTNFAGNRMWMLCKHIKMATNLIILGNASVKGYQAPTVYKGKVPYMADLYYGKAASYFYKAFRLIGGQKEVSEILADPNALILVVRSMIMQIIVEKVLSIDMFGCGKRNADDQTPKAKICREVALLVISPRRCPSTFCGAARDVSFGIISTMKPIFDLAACFWPAHGPNQTMIFQLMYDITTSAGVISLALRIHGEPRLILPVPGSPYNHQDYANRPAFEENVLSFPKYVKGKIMAKKDPSELTVVRVLSAHLPLVILDPKHNHGKVQTTIVNHGEVVTYETTKRDTYKQVYYDGTIRNNFVSWFFSLFTATRLRKVVFFFFVICMFVVTFKFAWVTWQPKVISVSRLIWDFLASLWAHIWTWVMVQCNGLKSF